MSNVIFKPEQVASGEFEGQIVLRKPNFDERFGYIESFGEGGIYKQAVEGQEGPDPLREIKFARQLVAASEKHYEKVELKRKEDGQEFKSFDDLSCDGECDKILIEAARFIILPKVMTPKKKKRSKTRSQPVL